MKNSKRHWYLVAQRAEARIFEQTGIAPTLTVVYRFENSLGRLKDSELVSDRQGRSDHSGSPGHIPVGSDYSPKEGLLKTFLHEVASFLESKADQKAFDSIVLVAEPSLLGEIKHVIGQATTSRLKDSVIKDLAHVPDRDMDEVLKGNLCMREDIEPMQN
jgi:protein required for attachment to host cells